MILNGKNAIVTGSSRGIGLSIAELLSKQGAHLVANSRDFDQLALNTSHLPRCLRIPADVTDPGQAQSLIAETIKHLDEIDILVCNVGSGASVTPGSETVNEWHRMFALNFFSAVNVIEAAKPFLKRGASIVCISSICGNEAIPGAPVTYSTAKSALNSYINSISRYFGKLGIRINGVAPGNVLFPGSVWDLKMRSSPQVTIETIATEVPMSDFATAEDIAEIVLWLASDKSKFVTGSIYTVDGGQTRSIGK